MLRRPADFCARHGGEEFVVILPQTGREGAQVVAESTGAKVAGRNRVVHFLNAEEPTADAWTFSSASGSRTSGDQLV